jgi:hypothetical protein
MEAKTDLEALCASLKKQGVTPVCDVVINHRTADAVGEEGAWNVYADLDQDGEPVHWGQWAITCDDPLFHGKGGYDSGENYGPAPDLDHANPDLRFTLKRWLVWLRDEIGFGGFRFDFVRGFAPEYVEEYIKSAFPPETRRVEPRRKAEKKRPGGKPQPGGRRDREPGFPRGRELGGHALGGLEPFLRPGRAAIEAGGLDRRNARLVRALRLSHQRHPDREPSSRTSFGVSATPRVGRPDCSGGFRPAL